ncbi:hypothetical protein SDC9_130518 [bioreactor metagenome]|uniref:Uncharacterized protein n=1 Tax=bioreactor metagenome TaxID=1076179 RepID=A0A645D2E3_9ZZZZ
MNINPAIVSKAAMIIILTRALPNISSASSFLFCPNLIDISELAPIPINMEKAILITIMGKPILTPAIPKGPTPFPMKTISTKL